MAKKKKRKVNYVPYDTSRKPDESLEKYYRRLAKVADQRLVRIEQNASKEHYKQALTWAYSEAMNDIKKWSGEKGKRFNVKPPKNDKQLIAKINDIKKFIEKPSSSKEGIQTVYEKRANSINKEYGTNFDWEDMATFYERESVQSESQHWGSKTYARAIGTIQRNMEQIINAIDKANEQIIRLNDEGITNFKDIQDNWKDIKVGNVTIKADDIIRTGREISFGISVKGKNKVITNAINGILIEHNYNIDDILGY